MTLAIIISTLIPSYEHRITTFCHTDLLCISYTMFIIVGLIRRHCVVWYIPGGLISQSTIYWHHASCCCCAVDHCRDKLTKKHQKISSNNQKSTLFPLKMYILPRFMFWIIHATALFAVCRHSFSFIPSHSAAKRFFATFGWQVRTEKCSLQIRQQYSSGYWDYQQFRGIINNQAHFWMSFTFWLPAAHVPTPGIISYKCIQFLIRRTQL